MKEILFYTAKNGKNYFKIWLMSLDKTLFKKVLVRIERVKLGNLGDYRSLKDDLYELKFDNGLRVYFTEIKGEIIILFCGGNKKTQTNDIKKAIELLLEVKYEKQKIGNKSR